MPPKIKSDPERATLSQSTLRNMDQTSKPRHTQLVQGYPMSSRHAQDDNLSNQDNFSLCPSAHHGHGSLNEMRPWTLNDADVLDNVSSTNPESPEVQLLSFSLSQQLLPSTVGPSDVMYHTGPDFPVVPDLTDHHDMEFSHSHDFHQYSSLVDLSAFDNDSCTQNGAQSHTPEDALSNGHSPHSDDSQMFAASENWNPMMPDTRNYHGSALDQLSSNIFPAMPVSPPLTEAGHDMSVTSSCSHSGYPAYMANDDVMMKNMTAASIGPHGINLGEPMFPLTPPVSEKDRNRTIRPPKHARRLALQTTGPQSQMEMEQELFQPPTVRETMKLKSKDTELRNPRDHPYYALPAQSDGKYYCPFANEESPCNHSPTTQKCAYHKYLDSHLKPYRCKVSACLDAQLQFSSNACLFRHEREAHGLHGHGDNPHLCFFEGCDRSVPGYGFPRRWNLFDHMRRVHDYIASDQPSSPETSSSGHTIKRKEAPGRKRRVTGITGAQPMKAQTVKRTRSAHTQANQLRATQTPTHHGQRLTTAERNYYNCRSRLLQELGDITPRDSAMNERVNATVQELMTLGLNYRHIEASQAATMTHGLPA